MSDLARLIDAARTATEHIAPEVDAAQLYADAALAAEQRIPAPLGPAIAATLAMAAHKRRISGLRGNLGEQHTTMALALAALAHLPATGGQPC